MKMKKIFLFLIFVIYFANIIFAQIPTEFSETEKQQIEYFEQFGNNVPEEKRSELNLFATDLAKSIPVDLTKGDNIGLVEEEGVVFITDSKRVKHDIAEYAKIDGVTKIYSDDSGRINLVNKNDQTITLQDSSISGFEEDQITLSDNSVLKLDENIKQNILVSGGKKECLSASGCFFYVDGIKTEILHEGGYLQYSEGVYEVYRGSATIGDDVVAGKVRFSTKSSAEDVELDLNKRIEAYKHIGNNVEKNLRGSVIKIKDETFGEVNVATSKKENKGVIACFGCDESSSIASSFSDKFDGYLNYEYFSESDNRYKAEFKGFIATSFDNDVFRESLHRNLVSSYYPQTDSSVLRIDSCENCNPGDLVFQDSINGNSFEGKIEEYGRKFDDSQLRYIQKSKIDNQNSFVEHRFSGVPDDYIDYPAGDAWIGSKTGQVPVDGYLTDFIISPSDEPQFVRDREIYIADETAFSYGEDGRRVDVTNVYISTKEGSMILNQFEAVDSGHYSDFLLSQGESELEVYFASQRQKASSLIEGQKDNLFEGIADYPIDEAEKLLRIYDDRVAGAEIIFEEVKNGKSYSDIFLSSSDPNVKSAFEDPVLLNSLNRELVSKAIDSGSSEVGIYSLTGSRYTISVSDASRVLAENLANSYSVKNGNHFYDPKSATLIWGSYMSNGIEDPIKKQQFQQFVLDVVNGGYLEPVTNYISPPSGMGDSVFLDSYNNILFTNQQISEMISEGIISEDDMYILANLNGAYQSDESFKNSLAILDAFIPNTQEEFVIEGAFAGVGVIKPAATTIKNLVRGVRVTHANSLDGILINYDELFSGLKYSSFEAESVILLAEKYDSAVFRQVFYDLSDPTVKFSRIDGTPISTALQREDYIRRLNNLDEIELDWYLKRPNPVLDPRITDSELKSFNSIFISERVLPDLSKKLEEGSITFEEAVQEIHSWQLKGSGVQAYHLYSTEVNIAGEYRTIPVFLGTGNSFPKVLPHPDDVDELMRLYGANMDRSIKELDALEGIIPQAEFEDKVIKLASYAQEQFVAIHPMVDGNGRTSRSIYEYVTTRYLPEESPYLTLPLGQRSSGEETLHSSLQFLNGKFANDPILTSNSIDNIIYSSKTASESVETDLLMINTLEEIVSDPRVEEFAETLTEIVEPKVIDVSSGS